MIDLDFLIVDASSDKEFSIINASGVLLCAEYKEDHWVLRFHCTDDRSVNEILFVDTTDESGLSGMVRDYCKISSLTSTSKGFLFVHVDPSRTCRNMFLMKTLTKALEIDDDNSHKLKLPFRYLLDRMHILPESKIPQLESVIAEIDESRGRVIAAYLCLKQAKQTCDGLREVADSMRPDNAGIYQNDGVYYFVDGAKNAVNIKRNKESYDIDMRDDDILLKNVSQKDAQAVMRELANVNKWHVVCMPDQENMIRNLCHELLVDFELSCVVTDDVDHIKPQTTDLSAHAYAIMCFNRFVQNA